MRWDNVFPPYERRHEIRDGSDMSHPVLFSENIFMVMGVLSCKAGVIEKSSFLVIPYPLGDFFDEGKCFMLGDIFPTHPGKRHGFFGNHEPLCSGRLAEKNDEKWLKNGCLKRENVFWRTENTKQSFRGYR